MRLFIAAPLPRQLKKELTKVRKDFVDFPAKWVEEENLHITLVFIGDIDASAVKEKDVPLDHCHTVEYNRKEKDTVHIVTSKISQAMEKIAAKSSPINLKTDGVTLFPNEHKARLLVVDLTDGTKKLHTLVEDIKRRLQEAKIDFDGKPFHPHITLTRLERAHPRKRRNIRQRVGDYEMREETFDVNEIALLESKLTPRGPIYKVLATAALTGT